MVSKFNIICFFFFPLLCTSASAKNFLTTEYQVDSRGFDTLNFTGLRSWDNGISVWGFVDFEGDKFDNTDDSDLSTHFLEVDLRSPTFKWFGLVLERNSSATAGNDLSRAGFYLLPKSSWLKDNGIFLYSKIFPVESDEQGWQASVAWNFAPKGIADGRISLGGFMDWNFESGGNQGLHRVSDTKLLVKIFGGVSFLMEYRRNDFYPRGNEGLGLGLHYTLSRP